MKNIQCCFFEIRPSIIIVFLLFLVTEQVWANGLAVALMRFDWVEAARIINEDEEIDFNWVDGRTDEHSFNMPVCQYIAFYKQWHLLRLIIDKYPDSFADMDGYRGSVSTVFRWAAKAKEWDLLELIGRIKVLYISDLSYIIERLIEDNKYDLSMEIITSYREECDNFIDLLSDTHSQCSDMYLKTLLLFELQNIGPGTLKINRHFYFIHDNQFKGRLKPLWLKWKKLFDAAGLFYLYDGTDENESSPGLPVEIKDIIIFETLYEADPCLAKFDKKLIRTIFNKYKEFWDSQHFRHSVEVITSATLLNLIPLRKRNNLIRPVERQTILTARKKLWECLGMLRPEEGRLDHAQRQEIIRILSSIGPRKFEEDRIKKELGRYVKRTKKAAKESKRAERRQRAENKGP
jgi:hypothetical protein